MPSHERLFRTVLGLLAVAALFGLVAGSSEPVVWFLRGTAVEPYLHELHIGNTILFSLSVGYLVSTFFWLLVVYFPERSRRRLLRDNLRRRYHDFKEDTVEVLLWCAIGSHDSELPKELGDHRRFREFFVENKNERWYAALNGLQDNQDRIDDILLELELFANEVQYVLNNVNIQDANVHSFLKRLNEHTYRLKNASVYSHDLVEYLGNFLWEVHARWSFIDGPLEDDVIENTINKL